MLRISSLAIMDWLNSSLFFYKTNSVGLDYTSIMCDALIYEMSHKIQSFMEIYGFVNVSMKVHRLTESIYINPENLFCCNKFVKFTG